MNLVLKDDMLVDSTIVKADASIDSMVKIELDPSDYWKKLDRYEKRPEKKRAGSAFSGEVEKDKMGKRRRDINRTRIRKKSTTDPDATLSYKAHIATDTKGIITARRQHLSVLPMIYQKSHSYLSHMRKF